jgi:hypothetical protein
MSISHHCGSSASTGGIFCRFCGALFHDEVPVNPRSPPSHPVNSPAKTSLPPSAMPVPSPVPPKARTFLSLLRVLGLAGIILIITAGVFFVFSASPLSRGTQNSSGVPQISAILPVNNQCPADLSLCSGKCADLKTDQENCGACGFSVPYGETCMNGQFSGSSGLGNNGLSPSRSGTTPAGSILTSATVSEMQGSCPSGRSSCNGTCRDLLTDAGNCGSCGNICPSGQSCQNRRCVLTVTSAPVVNTSIPITITPELSCSSGQIPCGSSCVDIFTDKKNCGVCGRSCGSQEICENARCGPACTQSGTSLCDDQCVDLDTDMNNCGACGTECETFLPNAKGSSCMQGECIIEQCKTDYADCDGKTANGCEINLRTDAGNCGSCGAKCATGQVCYTKKCSDPIK